MTRLLQLQSLIDRWAVRLGSVPALAARLTVGYGFFLTGSGKLRNLDNVIEFFRSLSIPYPELQAPFVARLEYYGGILLVLGLGGRLVAALLSSTMVVALLTADKDDLIAAWQQTGDKVPMDVTAFAYLLTLGWLICYGSGRLSLDGLVGWLMRRGVQTSDPGV